MQSLSWLTTGSNRSKILPVKNRLDPALLKRWIEILAIEPPRKDVPDPDKLGKIVPAVPLEVLDEKIKNQKPAIAGWLRKGTDLPILLSNSSDTVERIPGKSAPHQVVVHPTPKEFVGITWKSPIAGTIRVAARVLHAHPNCAME